MSTILTGNRKKVAPSDVNAACRVLVLYEDSPARLEAMQMCERLVSQFSDDLVFEFSWLKLQRLAERDIALHATKTAIYSDVVMFCTHGNDLPRAAVSWLDNWLPTGNSSKRAIALLCAEPVSPAASLGTLRNRLENAAARLGMDFLPLVMPFMNGIQRDVPQPFPIPSINHVRRPPDNLHDHWGLND